jgi:phage-related minor tail protein
VLDREALRLAQEKRFAVEEANIQSQLGVTGTGLKAGFIGPAAGAFESEMLKSGNTEQATRLAELTNQLTLAQVQAQGMESSVLAIGDAFGTAMTSGVASLIDGTATAQEVFASFLNTIADALMKAAAQMIAQYIAIGIARMFAGMGGGTDPTAAGGDWISAVERLSPNAKGNAFGANGIAPFARGGAFTNSVVGSPTMFKFAQGGAMRTGLMGEAGPEAIMPLKRGADGSLGVMASGGGGDVNVVVNVDAKGSSVEGDEQGANQLGRVISAAVQSELIKQQRPGGILAR